MAEVERMSLDDILEEAPRRAKPNAEPKIIEPAPEPKEPAAPKEAKASPKPDERVRGPDGKFAPKEPEAKPSAELKPEPKSEPEAKAEPKPEPKAAPPAQPEFTERERAFQAAMLEERRKRQEIERRAQAEAERQAQLKPDGTPKTFWDDPEATLAQFEARIQSQAISTRLSTAEQIARSRYGSEDFDAKVGKFAEVMQATPGRVRLQDRKTTHGTCRSWKPGRAARQDRSRGSRQGRARVRRTRCQGERGRRKATSGAFFPSWNPVRCPWCGAA